MDFKHLRSFAAVVEQQSFSKAAELLYLSQPSITTHIQLLEEELGVALLNRNARRIELTAAGKDFYDYTVRILTLQERMISTCGAERPKEIRIGTSTVPSAYVLPDLLPGYREKHPDISFFVSRGDSRGVQEGVTEGIYDLGLVGSFSRSSDLEFSPLCDDKMVLITAPGYAEAQGITEGTEAERIRRLLACPMLLREAGSASGGVLERVLEYYQVSPGERQTAAVVSDPVAQRKMVAAGMGVACVSSFVAEQGSSAGRLVVYELPEEVALRKLWLVYRSNHPLKEHVQDFAEYVRGFYRE